MSYHHPVLAAIFDMDGFLIDSEPLWDQTELDVFSSLQVDISRRHELPDTLGLRIDQTVRMWYKALLWNRQDQAKVTQRIIARAWALVEAQRPLLPGVEQSLQLCQQQGLKIALASAETLPYRKPHPQVYLDDAAKLGVDSLNCVALEEWHGRL